MKPDYRIELRVYDSETGETVDREDTYISVYDTGGSSFAMADICLGSLERRFPKSHAKNLSEYYSESDAE